MFLICFFHENAKPKLFYNQIQENIISFPSHPHVVPALAKCPGEWKMQGHHLIHFIRLAYLDTKPP